MWLFTKIGFFSGTLANFESPSYATMPRPKDWRTTPYIMVRARVESDLVRLCEAHAKALAGPPPEIFRMKGHDYPCRVLIPHAAWVNLVAYLVADVDYSNFKNAVEANALSPEEGKARHDLYMRVWSVMYGAEKWLASEVRHLKRRAKSIAQGGFNYWSDPRPAEEPAFDTQADYLYDGAEGASEPEDYDPDAHGHPICDVDLETATVAEALGVPELDEHTLSVAERFNQALHPPKPQPRRLATKPARRRGRRN